MKCQRWNQRPGISGIMACPFLRLRWLSQCKSIFQKRFKTVFFHANALISTEFFFYIILWNRFDDKSSVFRLWCGTTSLFSRHVYVIILKRVNHLPRLSFIKLESNSVKTVVFWYRNMVIKQGFPCLYTCLCLYRCYIWVGWFAMECDCVIREHGYVIYVPAEDCWERSVLATGAANLYLLMTGRWTKTHGTLGGQRGLWYSYDLEDTWRCVFSW